jgi:hypothetical protein
MCESTSMKSLIGKVTVVSEDAEDDAMLCGDEIDQ